MQRKFLVLVVCCLVVGFCGSAWADPIVLTFEGLRDLETVSNYYNNGTGGSGSGPGANYGIEFSSNSLALINGSAGGSGNVEQTPSGVTSLLFLSGSAATMNVTGGFDTGFSFYYAAPFYTGTINVWSGLNGTGSLLATINLPTTTDGAGVPGCGGNNYCPFSPFGVSFDGTAMSVDFAGTANFIVFDNITLGSATPGNGNGNPPPVPEPATLTLIGSGIAGLATRLRKTK